MLVLDLHVGHLLVHTCTVQVASYLLAAAQAYVRWTGALGSRFLFLSNCLHDANEDGEVAGSYGGELFYPKNASVMSNLRLFESKKAGFRGQVLTKP